MRKVVTGEELAQLYNPDPFAMPRWRAPVYRTPFGIILAAKLFKLLAWIVRMIARHPLAASILAAAAVTWVKLGWITLAALVLAAVVMLIAWRWFWPPSFSRWVGRPARGTWRAWCYRRRWAAVMTIAGVAPWYQGRTLLPVLGKVTATRYTDRVMVRLVSGQSAADFAKCAENLAQGFGALLCRVRNARSGAVVLEFIRRDALAALVPAQPVPDHPDLTALPVGRREDGLPWLVKLHGTHVLIAGATGAGKASLLWGLVRAMFPLMLLPTWNQALDAIGDEAEPWHVARFGVRFDAQGVLAGSKDAARCIGYLTKYLTKQVGECHQGDTGPQRAHAARLAEALRFQPCSPRCANWLRYGIQPKNARPGLVPGRCKGKAHDADHLGYAGRRVLVSRKWSGKTLADHRADRKDWLLSALGVPATDPARYTWEPVAPGDPDHMEHSRRLLHAVADRARWQAALAEARRRAAGPGDPLSGRKAA